MRFNDVQDTRKKEARVDRRSSRNLCFEQHMARLADQNRERKIATVGGVTFTI